MQIEGLNYRTLGSVDNSLLDPIVAKCSAFDWLLADTQPETSGALAGGRTLEYPFKSRHPATQNKQYTETEKDLLNSSVPLLKWLISTHYPGYVFVRAEMATLTAGSAIKWHIDENHEFFDRCVRVHIPVTTNDKCQQLWLSTRGKETAHFDVGYMYEYNNKVKHTAYNHGLTHRTHIIADLIEGTEEFNELVF